MKEPHYNLRSEASNFKRENVKFTHYGIQSARHLEKFNSIQFRHLQKFRKTVIY